MNCTCQGSPFPSSTCSWNPILAALENSFVQRQHVFGGWREGAGGGGRTLCSGKTASYTDLDLPKEESSIHLIIYLFDLAVPLQGLESLGSGLGRTLAAGWAFSLVQRVSSVPWLHQSLKHQNRIKASFILTDMAGPQARHSYNLADAKPLSAVEKCTDTPWRRGAESLKVAYMFIEYQGWQGHTLHSTCITGNFQMYCKIDPWKYLWLQEQAARIGHCIIMTGQDRTGLDSN